ncbi:MAG TPA: ABC transporter substrate-binding protein [Candidatus Nanopelagicales bacterium]|nr:ABC transporter substrate-binding protein [Candidatus Nanopelagicales bacterium]
MRQNALRSLRRLLPPAMAIGLGLFASACSVIVDTNADQCETDADCAAIGGRVCSADRVCVASSGQSCSANSECVAQLGKEYVCAVSEGVCKNLRSDECQTLVGLPAADGAMVIGAIGPTSGLDEGIGLPIENSIRVALGDFAEASESLSDPPRPMVMVGCNDDSSSELAVAAAEHLVSVGSQAIIGAAFSGITLAVKDVTIPAGALLISPSATAVGIGELVDNSLVWRTAPPDNYQAKAISLYIDQYIRPQVTAPAPLKVAVLHLGDAYGSELALALEDEMILNGQRPTHSTNVGNYLRFDYGDPYDDTMGNPAKFEEAVTQTLALAPHIIVLAGFSEAVTDVFGPIEEGWNATDPRPFYVMTDGVVGSALWETIGQNGDLRLRVTGTTPGRATSNPVFAAFAENYNGSFSAGGAEVFGSAEAYDAAYLIAYAAATLGNDPPTGQRLAQALGQMVPPGTPIDAGPAQIPDALELLRSGGKFDFTGASGPLDFDLGKGEAAADIQIWCLPSAADGSAQASTRSGLFLDAADETIKGMIDSVCN